MCVCVQCAVIILATSVTGPDGEYMRKPVDRWTHEDVMAWVGALGNWAHHNVSHALQKEVSTNGYRGVVSMLCYNLSTIFFYNISPHN